MTKSLIRFTFPCAYTLRADSGKTETWDFETEEQLDHALRLFFGCNVTLDTLGEVFNLHGKIGTVEPYATHN
jgi:hypothetical protein